MQIPCMTQRRFMALAVAQPGGSAAMSLTAAIKIKIIRNPSVNWHEKDL